MKAIKIVGELGLFLHNHKPPISWNYLSATKTKHRNCRSVIYKDTRTQWEWVSVGNAWIAIEHPWKSLGSYLHKHTGNVLLKSGFEIQSP